MQERCRRRPARKRTIGMPLNRSVSWFPMTLGLVRVEQYFRMLEIAIARSYIVVVELTKAPTECDVLRSCERLIAEQQDVVRKEGAMDFMEGLIVQGLTQINSHDLRAERVG